MSLLSLCKFLKSDSDLFPEMYSERDRICNHPDESGDTLEAPNQRTNRRWFRRFQESLNLRRLKWFMVLACILVVAQESTHIYFNRTVHLWKKEFGFSEKITDWVTGVSGICHLVLTVFLINVSIKQHRVLWTSASIIIFGIACYALLIPEGMYPIKITEGKTLKEYTQSLQLYSSTPNYYLNHDLFEKVIESNPKEMCWLPFGLMVFFQIALGVSSLLLFIHGMIFIDDHAGMDDAVLLNGLFLGFKQMGPYIGTGLTWLAVMYQEKNIFATSEWLILCGILLVFGAILGSFPKFLSYKVQMKSAVCSLDSLWHKKDLWSCLNRIVHNKIVLLNILSSLFFWCAITNFFHMENNLNKAKFAYPDESIFQYPKYFQIIISTLTPILVFATILFTSSVIAKYNLRALNLAVVNTIVPTLLIMTFVAHMYLNCEKPKFLEKTIVDSFCNWNYNCDQSLYEPICVKELQKTYFSPCFAGCANFSYKNGLLSFVNCTCTTPFNISFNAYPGLCSMKSCYPKWITHDLIQLVIVALSNVALICHFVITLYSVHYSERAYALAIHVSVLALREFGPIRNAFKTLASESCRFPSPSSTCLLHDPVMLTRFILTLIITFLVLSSLSALFLTLVIRHKTCYSEDLIIGVPSRPWKRTSFGQTIHCPGYVETTVEVVPMMTLRRPSTSSAAHSQAASATVTAQIHNILTTPSRMRSSKTKPILKPARVPKMVEDDREFRYEEIWNGIPLSLGRMEPAFQESQI